MTHDSNNGRLKTRWGFPIIIALSLCLLFPVSYFAAPVFVPPGAGGEGIQSALDRAGAGEEVVLGAGKYLVRSPIMLSKDGQTLRGAGDSTELYLADGADCPVVVLGSLSADAAHPTKGLHLAGLFIDGNRKKQTDEVWRFLPDGTGLYNNGVDIKGTDGATVENVVCSHCRSGGLVSSAGTRRLTVRHYTAFDNQFDGLACYQTEDSHFSHLDLHDNLAAGISVDLSFNHNVIRDAIMTANDLGLFMREARDNEFEDLTIERSRHHGVFMAETAVRSAGGWRIRPGTECTGNTFSKLFIAHCGGKGFRVNDVGCKNNTIFDGQFMDNAQGGLYEAASNLVTMHSGGEHSQSAPPAGADHPAL